MSLNSADDSAVPSDGGRPAEAGSGSALIAQPADLGDNTGGLTSPMIRIVFVVCTVAIFLAVWLYTDGLDFPISKDEQHFWAATQTFAANWPPDVEQLRSYKEPMTPVSFLIWASLERATGSGISAGRSFNLVLCFVVLLIVGLRRDRTRAAVLSGVGLFLYPYFLLMGMHLYTDIVSTFFVILAFCLPKRSWPRALMFILAVSTRQYMVAFPAALIADELLRSWRRGEAGGLKRILPDAAAVVSVMLWFAFYGGLGPKPGLEMWPRHVEGLRGITPELGLYFLTTMGVYFVLPEFVLFRRWERARELLTMKSTVIAGALLALFVLFTPIFEGLPQGFFGRLCDLLPPPLRICIFFLFAWVAAVRFARISLSFWMVYLQLAIILTAWSAWEKYALPVVAVLWLLKAGGELDEEEGDASPPLAGGSLIRA